MASATALAADTKLHRGRVQAQGKRQPRTPLSKTKKGKIEVSVAWATIDPPTIFAMLAMLDEVWQLLPPMERSVRASCFAQARLFLRNAAQRGGVVAPARKTFRNARLQGGVRVDIEVWTGQAGVPDR